QDHLLPAVATGDAHRHHGDDPVRRRHLGWPHRRGDLLAAHRQPEHDPDPDRRGRRGGVLAGEPRDLRGLRLMALTDTFADAPTPARPEPAPGTPPASSPAAAGADAPSTSRQSLLDPGLDLTLRPMRYPAFYEQYKA